MSAIHPNATPKIACPCAACYAYTSHESTSGENVGPVVNHFESRMKTLPAERPMAVSFNPTSIAYQPFAFPYAPLGLIPSPQHSRFTSPGYPFPRFPEESAFGNIHATTDLTAKQKVTPSRQHLHRGFWNAHARAPERPRRVRTVFSPPQLEHLEKEFKVQQYIGSAQRIYIASQLGLSETQVKVWFQNRRIRWRKQNLASVSTS